MEYLVKINTIATTNNKTTVAFSGLLNKEIKNEFEKKRNLIDKFLDIVISKIDGIIAGFILTSPRAPTKNSRSKHPSDEILLVVLWNLV